MKTDQDTFTKDLLQTIKDCGNHATESNIYRRLSKSYGMYATMFFPDSIAELEYSGKVVKMNQGGVTWWEID